MTEEQVTKMSFDAVASLDAAELVHESLRTTRDERSLTRNSRLTAMAFNFGVGLELTLKLLYIRIVKQPYPISHRFVCLFNKLPTAAQADLRRIYIAHKSHYNFLPVTRTSQGTGPLSDIFETHSPLTSIEKVMELFDQIRLYTQRYSSEWYDSEDRSVYPYVPGWVDFAKKLIRYSQEF